MIPNFALVQGELIYRGGQPETERDWEYLWDSGVTQVIKLNLDTEGKDIVPAKVGLFKCPINKIEQLIIGPDRQTIIDAVEFIRDNTFIHCQHGQDRTGLIVALHRVKSCGWTNKMAQDEMLVHGFHPALLGLWFVWLKELLGINDSGGV